MSRTPVHFTQAAVARALRAVKQVGLDMAVEISPSGSIRIMPLKAHNEGKPVTDLDEAVEFCL